MVNTQRIFFRAYLCLHSFRSCSVLWAVSISRKIILIIKFILLFEAWVLPDIHSKFFSLVFSANHASFQLWNVTGGYRQHTKRFYNNKKIDYSCWFPVSNSNHQLNEYCEHQTRGNDVSFRLLIIRKNIWDQY